MHEMLHRANELAVKAANGTLSDEDRARVYIGNIINNIRVKLKEYYLFLLLYGQ